MSFTNGLIYAKKYKNKLEENLKYNFLINVIYL